MTGSLVGESLHEQQRGAAKLDYQSKANCSPLHLGVRKRNSNLGATLYKQR
jgi:hypothetical protein